MCAKASTIVRDQATGILRMGRLFLYITHETVIYVNVSDKIPYSPGFSNKLPISTGNRVPRLIHERDRATNLHTRNNVVSLISYLKCGWFQFRYGFPGAYRL